MPPGRNRRRGDVRVERRRPGQRASFEGGDEAPAAIQTLKWKVLGVLAIALALGIGSLIDRMWTPPERVWAQVIELSWSDLPRGTAKSSLPRIALGSLSTDPDVGPLEGFTAYQVQCCDLVLEETEDRDAPRLVGIDITFLDVGLRGENRDFVFRVTGSEREVSGQTWIELAWTGVEK